MTRSEPFLKTRQMAEALGVSPSTIKRWVDSGVLKATRTVGKHRLIALGEALRFAREHGYPLDGLEALAGASGSAEGVPAEGVLEALSTALRRGRAREARALILARYGAGGAVGLADDLIRPVLERIGHDWEAMVLDVFQEHRASRIVEAALMELVRLATPASPRPGSALAIGAAPGGDLYTIPGLLAELTLRERGWEVMNLGANLPLPSLSKAVRAHRPRLVWLSVSHLADPARFLQHYTNFHHAAAASGSAVALGGRALTPDLRAQLVASSFGDRMAHLADFARGLRPAAAPPAGGPEADRH